MKCSEAERRIYLYTELTSIERDETVQHLLTCAACRKIMDRATNTRLILRDVSQAHAEIPNKDIMVARVMQRVQEIQQKKRAPFGTFFSNPIQNPVRYGMAAISVFLLIAFVREYNTSVQTPSSNVSHRVETGEKVELNSASFHDLLIAPKEKNQNHTTSFYDCVMRCLHTDDANCEDCRVKIPQLN